MKTHPDFDVLIATLENGVREYVSNQDGPTLTRVFAQMSAQIQANERLWAWGEEAALWDNLSYLVDGGSLGIGVSDMLFAQMKDIGRMIDARDYGEALLPHFEYYIQTMLVCLPLFETMEPSSHWTLNMRLCLVDLLKAGYHTQVDELIERALNKWDAPNGDGDERGYSRKSWIGWVLNESETDDDLREKLDEWFVGEPNRRLHLFAWAGDPECIGRATEVFKLPKLGACLSKQELLAQVGGVDKPDKSKPKM